MVGEVSEFLRERAAAAMATGIDRRRLCIDPGFGFGKNLNHNLTMLGHLGDLQSAVGLPLLAGLSRKSMIGTLTARPAEQRLAGSIGAALVAIMQGARIVRVHDVAETVDAIKVWQAAMNPERLQLQN